MAVEMYLGVSKHWWVYLGLRSNRVLTAEVSAGRAVLFDALGELEGVARTPGTRYYLVCWDGVLDTHILDQTKALVGEEEVIAIYVAENRIGEQRYRTFPLYAEGELRFDTKLPAVSTGTRLDLWKARLKWVSMPLKNLSQKKTRLGEQLGLLLGKRRVVFCGAYGLEAKLAEKLCHRFGCGFECFDGYEYFLEADGLPYTDYLGYVGRQGRHLAAAVECGAMSLTFFTSLMHLIGREFFVKRLWQAGIPLFANNVTSGANVNVYTTPFYKQHVFLDFGSAAGRGNYPRLADLEYGRKKYVAIDLTADVEAMLGAAGRGELTAWFEAEWRRKEPAVRAALVG